MALNPWIGLTPATLRARRQAASKGDKGAPERLELAIDALRIALASRDEDLYLDRLRATLGDVERAVAGKSMSDRVPWRHRAEVVLAQWDLAHAEAAVPAAAAGDAWQDQARRQIAAAERELRRRR